MDYKTVDRLLAVKYIRWYLRISAVYFMDEKKKKKNNQEL